MLYAAQTYNDFVWASYDAGVQWTAQLNSTIGGQPSERYISMSTSYSGNVTVANAKDPQGYIYVSQDYGVTGFEEAA